MIYKTCDHGRSCSLCPNKNLEMAIVKLQEAAQLLEFVHENYDGISVKNIVTWYGDTKATLEMNEVDK